MNSIREGLYLYKSSGASIYIPKNIVKLLRLNPEEVTSLIMFSTGDYGFFLIKNTTLAEALKPQILDLRKRMEEKIKESEIVKYVDK